jgi:hypothetical protein
MHFTEKHLLVQLAKTWNNLDVSFIEHFIAEDFTYESQWVFAPIQGKDNFLPYLKSKFLAIETAIKNSGMKVYAELASHPDLQDKECIVLRQISSQETVAVLIVIEVRSEQISRIDICFIPDPETAKLSGIQPN